MTKDDTTLIGDIAEIAGELCEMRDEGGGCLVSSKQCREWT